MPPAHGNTPLRWFASNQPASGLPEPVFGDRFKDFNITITLIDPPNHMIYFTAEGRTEQIGKVYRANLATGESGHVLSKHYKDQWGAYYGGTSFPSLSPSFCA